jgi:hypothetical protein
MKKGYLRYKVILTILLLSFGLMIFHPGAITLVSENKLISDNHELKPSQDAIFDGLYLNYSFTMGTTVNTTFSYSHISGNDYRVNWTLVGADGTWDENLDTRLTSNSAGLMHFGDGNHAPLWIFTNSTLGDLIQIAVDGDGDHVFNVTREYAYNLPGFGTIDVWQLEDLVTPGGIALYEKSTGFLIKGFFTWGPTDNYRLDIVTTNLNFTYTTPDSGIFDGLYIRHKFKEGPLALNSNISYSEDPVGIYNVTWKIFLVPATYWNEEVANRTIYNSDTFNDWSHTLVWIHTNVTIDDIIPITVDGVGDHNFKVTGQKVQKLDGYGHVEVWILKDLLYPEVEVRYEKSTGLLIEGTFKYIGGNYSVEFLNTNANFTYVGAPDTGIIPGYNHFLLVGFLIVIPIIIVRIKKRK